MNKVAKATIGLMIVTMLSKILGFIREIILGASYGASIYSDIYITSMNIPIIIFSSIGLALGTTFIPLYYENYKEGGELKALYFTNNIFNIVLILGTILSILGFAFAEQLVKLFAIGFNGEELRMTVEFTKIMIFGGIFIGLSNIMSTILQIKEEFIIPGLIGIPFNIIIILSIILSIKINIYILPAGTLIAIFSQFLCQLPFAYRKGYRYKKVVNIKDKNIKKIIWLVAPVFIGIAVNQINVMLDRTLASTLVEGSISALNYANRLNAFVMSLFTMSISTVIYPILSKLSSEKNSKKFIESVVNSVNIAVLVVLPIAIGAMIFAKPIVKLLFQRGAFNEQATNMTSIALVFYSIGMVAFGLRDILGKVFYSLQDTKTPMRNGIISVVINIILNIILVKYMGHAGLAFATSISAIVGIILLFNSLKRKIKYFGQDRILKTAVKSFISALFMGCCCIYSYNIISKLGNSVSNIDIIALVTSIAIGCLIYLISVILLKVDEIKLVKSILNRKIKKS